MSAIEPVEQIQHQSLTSPFTKDLTAFLRRLAALPPATDTPYLTLMLDWRPDGTRPAVRTGQLFFDQEIAGRFDRYIEAHTPPHEILSADVERIRDFLSGEVDPAVQGIAIFACSANGLFETALLGTPLANRVVFAPTPALRTLAMLADETMPFLLVASDQRDATITLVDMATRRRQIGIQGTGFPRKQMQGGWSQRRYQMRSDERIEAFARAVAEELRRATIETRADLIVLAGNEQFVNRLREEIHPSVQERIAGDSHPQADLSDADLIAATLPIVEHKERDDELMAVGKIENGAGPGGGSVTGSVETLTALQTGQVMLLAMNDDFAAPGWADFGFPLYGVGVPPRQHPSGSELGSLTPVALDEELVRLAIQQGAEIEIVRSSREIGPAETVDSASAGKRTEAATRLDRLGGVGAILRFALSESRSTVDL